MKNNKDFLGTEKMSTLLFQLAVPAITAQLVNMLYNMVDRIYLGRIPNIGSLALTGVGVCFPILMLVSAFSNLVGMGGAPQASMKMGEKDTKAAEKILGNCFTTLIILAVTLTIFFLVFGEKLLYIFGASEDTIIYSKAYMNIYVCGSIFVMIALGLNPFITAQGFAKISMLTTVIGAIINIVLDPIFIFVFQMGVKGAALATVLSQAVSALWVLYFLFGQKTILKIKKEYMPVKRAVILPVLALGLSPFIMASTESILNICFNSSLQKYGGDLVVGVMTILSSCMQIVMLPLQGLAQGAQPITSYNYGAKNLGRVKDSFQLLLIISIIYTTAFWLLIMVAPGVFPSIFSNNAALVEKASWAIRIYMGCTFLMGAQIACQQTFIAIGQAKISTFLALLRKMLLLIPLIYILPLLVEDKVFGVFLAEPVADFIAVVTTVVMFTIYFRRLLTQNQRNTQNI